MQRHLLPLTSSLSLFLLIIALFSSVILPYSSAYAVSPSQWKAGRIIDDSVFENKSSMSVSQIQQFLDSKMPSCDTYGQVGGGWRATQYPTNPAPFTCLKTYKEVPKTTPSPGIPDNNYGRTDGTAPAGAKSAAELIWDASQTYNISPKVLLVNLQKESSLITDDWPLKNQFVYAMGARCPDSGPGGSANCDVNYAGFSMQIRESAKLYRYYLDNMQQPWWDNKRPFQNNIIQYDVDVNCGSSPVFMESRATTALYVYTPYQPNQASLDAGYGEGNACSSHGVRNFWLFYNDWFGSGINTDFQLVKSSTGTQQYVIYNNLKQLIPSPYVKVAWGLDNFPLETVDQAYIDSLENGPTLDIVFRANSGTDLYVVDRGIKYRIKSIEMLKTWGLDGRVISNVPTGLSIVPADGGELSYTLRKSGGDGSVYMADGLSVSSQTILRHFADANVLFGMEGQNVPIITASSELFDTLDNDIRSDVSSTKIAYNGNEYQVVSQQKLFQSAAIAPLYPGIATTVSEITFNRLSTSSPVTQFIRADTSPEVYIVQNGKKQHVTSPEVLSSWLGDGYINVVNASFAASIPLDLASLTTTVGYTTSATYVLDGGKKSATPANLANAYKTGTFSISAALANSIPDGNKVITRFVTNTSTKQIFMMRNDSTLLPISTIETAQLWGVNEYNTLRLPADSIAKYSISTAFLSQYVTNGTTSYLIYGGQLHIFDNFTWRQTAPQLFSDGTLTTFTVGDPLGSVGKSGPLYYKIIDGVPYVTTDAKIATAWNIDNSAPDIALLVASRLTTLHMLTPFIAYNNEYYVADGIKLFRISPAMYANLRLGYPIMYFNPALTGLTPTAWDVPLFTNTNGGSYVIDSGLLRTFQHIVILTHWMNGIGSTPPVVSNNFISMFRPGTQIERAIKSTSSQAIYSAEGAKKRWILSASSYNNLYAPYTVVSDDLLNTMSSGVNIP
jgi:hypothetical protein